MNIIESIELRELKMPLVTSFETSGWKEEDKDCIIVAIKSGKHTGYAECAVGTAPAYAPETIASAWHVMENFLVPTFLGKQRPTPSAQTIEILSVIRGNNMAKASFEMALWDLEAKMRDEPLSNLLGGTKQKISSGVSVGLKGSMRELVEAVSKYLDEGYQRIKLKIKPGNDVEQVKILREEFHNIPLMADANGAYVIDEMKQLLELDTYNLQMLEQPFAWDDFVNHAKLQKIMRTSICLDETVASSNDMETALALGSCKILNIKPARLGGYRNSIEVHNLCRGKNLPVWCGGLLETGIGRAHNVALASLPGFVLPNDISASNRYFERDIVNPEFHLNIDGTISVPSSVGIGVEVVDELLEKYTVAQKHFKHT